MTYSMKKISKDELQVRINSEYGELQKSVRSLGKILRDKKKTKGKVEVALNKVRTNAVILTSYVEDL